MTFEPSAYSRAIGWIVQICDKPNLDAGFGAAMREVSTVRDPLADILIFASGSRSKASRLHASARYFRSSLHITQGNRTTAC